MSPRAAGLRVGFIGRGNIGHSLAEYLRRAGGPADCAQVLDVEDWK